MILITRPYFLVYYKSYESEIIMNVTLGRVLTAASVVVFALTALGASVDSVSIAEAMSAGLALLGAGQLTHD